MTDPGSKVFVAIAGEDVPAVVLESRPSHNGDYYDCRLRVAIYNAITREYIVSLYPKPIQSYKLHLRYKDLPGLDVALQTQEAHDAISTPGGGGP